MRTSLLAYCELDTLVMIKIFEKLKGIWMDEKNDNNLEIECPHCSKENKINLSTEIKCKHCEKPLIGQKYRKPFMSAMTAFILGVVLIILMNNLN